MRPLPSSLLLAMLRRVSFSGALACVLSLPRILFDMLLAPVVVALSVLASLLLPLQANAQTAPPPVDYQFQKALSKIVAGSGSGLVVKQPGTMNIVNAGKVVGSFALNEKRLIDLATLAKYARASTVPAVLALGATELINYGLQKCADGTWCKPQVEQGDPSNGTRYWYNNYQGACWGSQATLCGWQQNLDTLWTAFAANNPNSTFISWAVMSGATSTSAVVTLTFRQSGTTYTQNFSMTGYGTRPASGATVPATDADVETAWKGAFQANPFIQEKYWGFEDQTQNLKAWEAALAQTAEVINGTVTEVRPAESTTKPKVGGGTETTTKQTTCTYTATGNTDAATMKENPLKVTERCTTTTTAPDGTQTQEVTEKAAAPQGSPKIGEKVELETCGLPGKPACKIDETGTKAQTDVDAALTQQSAELDSRLSVVEQAANDSLSSVEQKHGSVHILDFFNIFPTFATEQCENPRVPGVGGGDLPVDVCTYYYMLKDVVSFGVSILVIIDSIQLVREAVKV